MMPATMPALSCSPPRVAETLETSDTSKASGSAPYLSTLARSVALLWVKLPEICGLAARDRRADRRGRDRLAVEHDGEPVLRARPAGRARRVAFSNAVPPSELKVRLTTHSMPFCGMPALAPVSWLPWIRVGPSRYFSVPSRLQENSGWSETSTWSEACVAGEGGEVGRVGLARLVVDRLVGRGALALGGRPRRGRGRRGGRQPGQRPVVPAGAGAGRGGGAAGRRRRGAWACSRLRARRSAAGVALGSALGATGGVTCSAE